MQFNSLKEKEEFYNITIIDTKTALDELFDKLKVPTNNIWRGLNNALFSNCTSLQLLNFQKRELNSKKEVIQYIDKVINDFDKWNNGLLVKYFKNYGIKKIPIFSKLSILRHNGVPTPFLDWTRNPLVALYFAIETNISFKKFRKNRFISLYSITSDHPYYQYDFKSGLSNEIRNYDSYKNGLNERLETMSKHCDETMLEYSKINFHKTFCQDAFNNLDFIYGNIEKFPIQKIEDSENDDFLFYLKNNYNITSQDGLFMLNIYPYLPLEKAIFERIIEQTDDLKMQNEGFKKCKDNFLCYDISIKFIPIIKAFLNNNGINKEFIYPDLNRLKNEIK